MTPVQLPFSNNIIKTEKREKNVIIMNIMGHLLERIIIQPNSTKIFRYIQIFPLYSCQTDKQAQRNTSVQRENSQWLSFISDLQASSRCFVNKSRMQSLVNQLRAQTALAQWAHAVTYFTQSPDWTLQTYIDIYKYHTHKIGNSGKNPDWWR